MNKYFHGYFHILQSYQWVSRVILRRCVTDLLALCATRGAPLQPKTQGGPILGRVQSKACTAHLALPCHHLQEFRCLNVVLTARTMIWASLGGNEVSVGNRRRVARDGFSWQAKVTGAATPVTPLATHPVPSAAAMRRPSTFPGLCCPHGGCTPAPPRGHRRRSMNDSGKWWRTARLAWPQGAASELGARSPPGPGPGASPVAGRSGRRDRTSGRSSRSSRRRPGRPSPGDEDVGPQASERGNPERAGGAPGPAVRSGLTLRGSRRQCAPPRVAWGGRAAAAGGPLLPLCDRGPHAHGHNGEAWRPTGPRAMLRKL